MKVLLNGKKYKVKGYDAAEGTVRLKRKEKDVIMGVIDFQNAFGEDKVCELTKILTGAAVLNIGYFKYRATSDLTMAEQGEAQHIVAGAIQDSFTHWVDNHLEPMLHEALGK